MKQRQCRDHHKMIQRKDRNNKDTKQRLQGVCRDNIEMIQKCNRLSTLCLYREGTDTIKEPNKGTIQKVQIQYRESTNTIHRRPQTRYGDNTKTIKNQRCDTRGI